MTKRPLQYREAFTKGLRQKPDPRNQDRLAICKNAKPSKEGLRGWTEIPQLVAQASVDFPFPQMFAGKEQLLLLDKTNIYFVDQQSGAKSAYGLRDAQTGNPTTLAPGGVWHFVDLGKVFMATNGTTIVFRDNIGFDYGSLTLHANVSNEVQITSMCEWRGRVFSAGLEKSLAWKDEWKTLFASYRAGERVPDDLGTMSYDIDNNFVLWSSVGKADFSFRWLFYPEEATAGFFDTIGNFSVDGYSGGKNPLQEALLQAEFGLMRMPFKGSVLCVKPHPKGVVVYGTDYICLLEHHSSPFSTFGLVSLSTEYGISDRGAVGGTEDTHVFVNTLGQLCMLDATAKIIVLGYEEFLLPLLTKEIIVSYKNDLQLPEVYICNEDKGFVLTTQGLGEMWQSITSSGVFRGNQVVVSKNQVERDMQLSISDYDGGLQGLKAVQTVRVASNMSDGLFANSMMNYEQNKPFVESRPRMLSPKGTTVLGDTGLVLKLGLRTANPSGLLIEQLDCEVETIDKSNIRTMYGIQGSKPNDWQRSQE